MSAQTWLELIAVIIDAAILYVLIVEYWFDKKIYEQKRKKIKRTKDRVVVQVVDGVATIIEQPKDVNVVIENQGQ